MKFKNRIFFILSACIILSSPAFQAQENTNNNTFKVKSFSISPTSGFYGQPDGTSGNDFFGYTIMTDVTFQINKHLLSLAPSAAFGLFSDEKFVQINALYGREFKLSKRFYTEIHGGIGYLYLEGGYNEGFFDISFDRDFQSTIGFPVMGKLKFMTSPKFSVGLTLQTNFNPEFFIYSGGISLQWNLEPMF